MKPQILEEEVDRIEMVSLTIRNGCCCCCCKRFVGERWKSPRGADGEGRKTTRTSTEELGAYPSRELGTQRKAEMSVEEEGGKVCCCVVGSCLGLVS